jgi:hypothetical protein
MGRFLGHRYLHPVGLRKQALAVCATLLILIGLLGTRAYSVAKTQYREISDLVNHDLKAEGLLVRMESQATLRDQAQRKLRITRDRAYGQLVGHHSVALTTTALALEQTLFPTHPELAAEVKKLTAPSDMSQMRAQLHDKRAAKLKRASVAASSLLGWILSALFLTIGVTAWVIYLFYRGLIDPLAKLKEGLNLLATQGENLSPESRSKGFAACLIASKRLEFMINNMLHHSKEELEACRHSDHTFAHPSCHSQTRGWPVQGLERSARSTQEHRS